jgi:hypothetical protein
MTADSRGSPQEEAALVERVVFEIVVELHPDHLTPAELVLKMAGDGDHLEAEAITEAIRDLRRSGLLRHVGEVVVPTHAALSAVALLTGP